MGMDYQYAGSASYPRFDQELADLAVAIGGKVAEGLDKELKESTDLMNNNVMSMKYVFGPISQSDEAVKFIFPEDIPDVVNKWFNNIYEKFSPDETIEIHQFFACNPSHKDAILRVSNQIAYELEELVMNGEGWAIT